MYNSEGYVMIDMKDVNMSVSSQHITGIYNRVVSVIDTNKLALIVNAGSNTPMAAVVHKRLNYYVINTTLYIFTINSNDIVIIEEAGTATVDVTIVPTLLDGEKIADFSVGATEGSLYAPRRQSDINDNVTAVNSTWSSDKIDTELSNKADTADLATVATTGSYDDLTNKPTIPTKVSELQNDSGYVAFSSLATVATSGSYDDLTNKPTIPTKVSELQNDSGYITSTNVAEYSNTEKVIGKWTDGKNIYRKVLTGTVANNSVDISVGEKIDTCVNYSLIVTKNGINFKAPYRMEDGSNYYQIYCFCNNASGNTNSNIYATFASSTADYFNGCEVTCIVEYTKR